MSLSQEHLVTALDLLQRIQADDALEQEEHAALQAVRKWLGAHLPQLPGEEELAGYERARASADGADGGLATSGGGASDAAVEGSSRSSSDRRGRSFDGGMASRSLADEWREFYRPNVTAQRELVLRKASTLRISSSFEQLAAARRASRLFSPGSAGGISGSHGGGGGHGGHDNPEITRLLSNVGSFDAFDVFRLERAAPGRALELVALALAHELGLVEALQLPLDKLRAFLRAIERSYRPNPYHCALHAADVTQTTGAVLLADGFKARLTPLELLATLLAAVVHDAGHPGVSNDFLIRTRADAAITYNDVSVNENAHLSLAFRTLLVPGHNFLAHLPGEDFRFVRSLVVDIVLKTDMKAHHELLSTFHADVALHGADVATWDARARTHALSLILHCADIGNTTKPRALAIEWAKRVSREFWLEGRQQAAAGLPVGPLNDEAAADVPRTQAVFVELFVRPCFDALARIAPASAAATSALLASNYEWWASLAAAGVKHVPDAPPPPPRPLVSSVSPAASDASWGSLASAAAAAALVSAAGASGVSVSGGSFGGRGGAPSPRPSPAQSPQQPPLQPSRIAIAADGMRETTLSAPLPCMVGDDDAGGGVAGLFGGGI